MENQDTACDDGSYIAWDDPDFVEKFGEIALRNYRQLRALKLAESARPKPEAAAAPTTGRDVFSIGPENLPEQFIDRQTYDALMRARCELRSLVDCVPPEIDDPLMAIILLARYGLCWCGYELAQRTACFLMCEWRFHREFRVLTDTVGILDIAGQDSRFTQDLQKTQYYALAANMAYPSLEPHATYASAFNYLHFVADCYFTLVQGVFPCPEVIRCRNAFSGLLFNFSKVESLAVCDRFRECAEVMVRAIAADARKAVKGRLAKEGLSKEDCQHPSGDAIPPAVRKVLDDMRRCQDELKPFLTTISSTVKRMDRRQDDEISNRRAVLKNFTQLTKGKGPLSRQDVAKALMDDPKAYPQLGRIREPRRSHVRLIIDWTKLHPIVPVSQNPRPDDYTLGKAVDAACRANRDKLPQDPAEIKRLKSCCYGLGKRHSALYCYRVDH